MDPHIVFDCEKVLPNRFDLAVAAAARVRALSRGGEPRIRISETGQDRACPARDRSGRIRT